MQRPACRACAPVQGRAATFQRCVFSGSAIETYPRSATSFVSTSSYGKRQPLDSNAQLTDGGAKQEGYGYFHCRWRVEQHIWNGMVHKSAGARRVIVATSYIANVQDPLTGMRSLLVGSGAAIS